MLDTKVGHAEGVFYCLINSNVKESQETFKGFMSFTSSLFCSLEESLELTLDDFTDAGKEMIPSGSATVSLSETCWPQGAPGGMTEAPMDSLVVKKLDSAENGWQ